MNQIPNTDPAPLGYFDPGDGRKIAYRLRPHDPRVTGPTLVFLPGYGSDMEGTKALQIDGYCAAAGLACLRFDYSGTGSSGGDFADGTLVRWLDEVVAMIDLVIDGPVLLVGSSMGGWIALHVALQRPARVAATTGVAEADLRMTARVLADASPHRGGTGAMVLTGRGAEQHLDGTDTVTAAINLSLALGLPGRRASGYGCLTGQGNGQGGREHGQKADQLPGYRMIDDPAARAHVAGVWGVDPDSLPGPGRSAYELLDGLGTDDGARALLVFGSNIVVSAPRATHVTERLAALDLLVVCDLVMSETAAMADVVLPVTQWAEETGTMTNLEGRVIRRRQALPGPEGARSELWIMAEIARRLGAASTWSLDPSEVFDELARASDGGVADYSGLSHALLDTGIAAHWPYPAGGTGTPRLFAERFGHPDGRARLVAVIPAVPVVVDRGEELTLVTRDPVFARYGVAVIEA